MALRAWWLRTKLNRTESKLKRLRAQQRLLRQKGDDASKDRIHAITEEIRKLAHEEERLRAELTKEGEGGSASA